MRIRMMTDLHYTEHASLETGDSFYREYLRRFFQEGPEAHLYISLGDLTQNGEEAEYRAVFRIIDSLGHRSAFIHIPGNHDLYAAPVAETERWAATSPITDGYGSLDTESALLVFLNTCQPMKPLDWGGRFEGGQLDWFKARLSEAGGRPLLAFAHHPLPNTTALSEKDMMRVERSELLREAMKEAAGPCFWFNGHNHIQSIVRDGSWTYVQTASAVCLPCWRDVTVSDGIVRVDTVTWNGDAALMELARQTLAGFPSFHRVPPREAEGGPDDRSVEIRYGIGTGHGME